MSGVEPARLSFDCKGASARHSLFYAENKASSCSSWSSLRCIESRGQKKSLPRWWAIKLIPHFSSSMTFKGYARNDNLTADKNIFFSINNLLPTLLNWCALSHYYLPSTSDVQVHLHPPQLHEAQKCIVIARIKPRQAQLTFDRLGEWMSDRRCQAKQGREEHEPLRT